MQCFMKIYLFTVYNTLKCHLYAKLWFMRVLDNVAKLKDNNVFCPIL